MSIKSRVYNFFPGIRILMMHHMGEHTPNQKSSCIISSIHFKEFIRNKSFLGLDDTICHPWRNNAKYCLTIDDGLSDLYDIYQIAKDESIPITAFISTSFIDTKGYITSDQLVEMAENPLVTIGSHGRTHRKLCDCSDVEASEEIIMSKQELEAIINEKVRYFAYPNGVHSGREIDLVRTAGYEYAFGVIPRKHTIVTKFNSRYCLPRFNLTDDTYGVLK